MKEKQFRFHRGSFFDSMATAKTIDSLDELQEIITSTILYEGVGKVVIEPYYMERDYRCGWEHTFVVKSSQGHVIGFTNCSASELSK